MTLETMAILAVKIHASYTANVLPDRNSVNVWASLLKDFPDADVIAAVDAWLKTEERPPTPAGIIKAMQTIRNSGRDWTRGWELVLSMIRNYGTYLQDIGMTWLRKQDPIAADAVTRIGYGTLCRMTEYSEVNLRQTFKAVYESIDKNASFRNATGLEFKPRLIE